MGLEARPISTPPSNTAEAFGLVPREREQGGLPLFWKLAVLHQILDR